MYTVKWRDYSMNRIVDAAFSGTLPECIRWLAECRHVYGPNGPCYTVTLFRPNGTEVDDEGWKKEIEDSGLVPVWVRVNPNNGGPSRIVDAISV